MLDAHPRQLRLYRAVWVIVVGVSALSLSIIVLARPPLPARSGLQIAVFAAVATVPHWAVEGFARLAAALGENILPGDHKPGFRNIGAYLGMVERPLFLASLVAGYPGFVAVWFVFKGIAGYRVGLSDVRARRMFQLFLLNNAVSLAGVALGWLVWKLLDLPTHRG